MSNHTARLIWNRSSETMDAKAYSRDHQWTFDSGVQVTASAAAGPAIPPGTVGDRTVDPEEAVVAALASCHMLFFLALAAKRGLTIDRYEDAPHGLLESKDGATQFTTITLAPQVTWGGAAPDAETVATLHREAHKRCYIANSLKSHVVIEGVALAH
ncbi:MAG: OsmC family protein [Myxococcales bacterium]|nr:OsmC family protein [Myxococcales bacterium]